MQNLLSIVISRNPGNLVKEIAAQLTFHRLSPSKFGYDHLQTYITYDQIQ